MSRQWAAVAVAAPLACAVALAPARAQEDTGGQMRNFSQGSATAPIPRDPPKDANDPGYILEQFPDRLPETTNQCIFFRTLYDWKALNSTNLIVWAPSRNHPYHLQLDRPCPGLRFAYSIGFTSRDSRLCGYGGDAVLVESGGGRADRCPIGAITKLTDESLKALLAQAPGRGLSDKRDKADDGAAKDDAER